jgi:flagellar export protein FliJ
MKPRNCWPILLQKAQAEVSLARDRSLAAKKQLEEVQSNHVRIKNMIAEYTERQTDAEQQRHSVRDSLNSRAFLSQLQVIASRLSAEENAAAKALNETQKALIAAELEASKMQTLLDHDLAQVQQANDRREQKVLDEHTLIRHQWRTEAG